MAKNNKPIGQTPSGGTGSGGGGASSGPPGPAAPGYTWQQGPDGKWVQIALAAVGAYMSYRGAQEANRAASGSGGVNMTTERNPWGPSDVYRQFMMDRGAQMLGMQDDYFAPVRLGDGRTIRSANYSTRPAGTGGGNLQPFYPAPGPNPSFGDLGGKGSEGIGGQGGGPAGGGRGGQASGQGGGPNNPAQKPPRSGRGGGGGGGQGQQQPGFTGMSTETDTIRNQMMNRAQQGNPLYGQAESYIGQNLSGSGDSNMYRTETADMLRDMNDPDLRRFKDMLFEGQMPGSANQAGGGGRTGGRAGGAMVSYGYQQGSPQAMQSGDAGTVGVDSALKDILAGKEVTGQKEMKARIQASADKALNERLKANKLRAAGSGMYGATPYQNIEGQALSEYGTGLVNELGALDYGLYSDALGLGTQYDIAAQDRAASERNAGAGASAAAYAADKDAETRMSLARLDALQGAIGMGMDQSRFQTSGMGTLADLYSQDQRFSLGSVGDISGLSLRDWGAAGNLSLGADANRNSYLADRGRERVGMAGVGVQRQQLAEDRRRYDREAPWMDMMRYSDILNAASGGFGTTTEIGTDRRSASPSHSNPWAQAIAGGAAGYSLGQQMRNS